MARMTSTGHRKLGQRLSWGEPSSQFKVWTAPRMALPAKRKTALRMAFSKCNLETRFLRGHAFQLGLAGAAAERRVPEAGEAEEHHRPGRWLWHAGGYAGRDAGENEGVVIVVPIAAGTAIFPRHEGASRTADIRVSGRHGERIDMLERIRIFVGSDHQVTVGYDDGGS
jgi:hypothetical protein